MSVSREELYRRLRAAEKVLDREWIREMAGQHGGRVLENTFQVAAGVVALQAIGIYAERAKQDPDEHPFLERLAARDSLDTVFHALTQRLQKDFLAVVAGDEEKKWQEAEHLEAWVWQHVSAWALDTMEKELGTQAVQALPEEDFDRVFTEYVFDKQDVGVVIANLIDIYAQDLARLYLEALDPEHRPLHELRRFLGLPESADLPSTVDVRSGAHALPDAFATGVGRIPSNPALSAALGAIWKGGPRARFLRAGWSDAGTGKPTCVHMVKQGGRVLVYPNLMHSASDPLPTTEALWAFVESLNPFTADVALAVLAQMVEPSTGDRPKYPLLQPVRITANAILRYKGIQRYGAERRLLEHRVYEEMERLRGLTFDVERVKAYDADTDRWPKEGASWEGDRLFDIVKVEKWQETLIGGERQRIEVAWSVRAGQWAYWWLNAQGRVYVSRMARVLLELDHRENRPAAVMAKKIGQLLALWRASETLERRIDGLLQDIGELPEPQKRDKDWAGRTRDRFDEAMLTLQEAGVFVNVEWPDGYGPGDKDRSKGWVAGWLAAKVRITLPSTAPELPEPPPKLPAPKRKRRAKQPAKVQLLDGSAIRRARTERGWTQQDLARHLGIAPAYLSQIESGKRLPSKELAGKLKVWLEEA